MSTHKCKDFQDLGGYWKCSQCGRIVKKETIPETIAGIDKLLESDFIPENIELRLLEIHHDLSRIYN